MEVESTENLCLSLTEVEINPEVWATGGKIGKVISAQPVQITLKNPNNFLRQKQYPLKPEGKQGLIPLIKNLKGQGLLIKCNSPCNTLILGVQKPNGEWCLIQDFCPSNEAVIPLHPVMPNPLYSILSNLRNSHLFYYFRLEGCLSFLHTFSSKFTIFASF